MNFIIELLKSILEIFITSKKEAKTEEDVQTEIEEKIEPVVEPKVEEKIEPIVEPKSEEKKEPKIEEKTKEKIVIDVEKPTYKKPAKLNQRFTTLEALREENTWLWHNLVIRPEKIKKIDSDYISKLKKYQARYEYTSLLTNVPWWFIGVVHSKEASFRFTRHLHNGDPLNKRTVQKPAGRPMHGKPPFTWEESAVDAILVECDKKHVNPKTFNWENAAEVLWFLEAYNGFGYRKHRDHLSPYVWCWSTYYEKGGYPHDGKYDKNFLVNNAGAAVLLKRLGIKLK